ncbi:hypothetical protein [Methylopila jiangsuensis]|uniref:hypothetical protein n=1 Tax=Methylopila jiangsuensis TaxID=586230 RepID=UPI0022F2B44E|nr:hypothetical protein [Methylopila jiangsuensis]
MHVDDETVLGIGRDHDALDQRANQAGGLRPAVRFGHRPNQRRHLLPLAQRHVRVQRRRSLLGRHQQPAQLLPPVEQDVHVLLELGRREAVLDGLDHPVVLPVELHELGPVALDRGVALDAQAVEVRRALLAEGRHERRIHQVPLQDEKRRALRVRLPHGLQNPAFPSSRCWTVPHSL